VPEVFGTLRDFMAQGGNVLWLILAVLILLWWLMLDRYWYLYRVFPEATRLRLERWQGRAVRNTWYAEQIRRQFVSELDADLGRNLKLIAALTAVLPMLGLLGTVTGMIRVFDVLAVTGSSNPRAMADGISAATIPTMAGMVAALSTLPFAAQLNRRHRAERRRLTDKFEREWESADGY